MSPGRELDALVSEKVMGFSLEYMEPNKTGYVWHHDGEDFPTPHYSTDIAAAWEVVEKANLFSKHCFCLWNNGESWCVGETNGQNDCLPHVKGETAPHAICLAALRAVGAIV